MIAGLAARLAALLPAWPRCQIVVAVSGGMDSVALLHALTQLRRQPAMRGRLRLRAVHVDHRLQSVSGDWRRFCERLGRSLCVPTTICDAAIRAPRGASLEAVARDARYALLGAALKPGEILLTAQHQDDQMETLLLQLLRGAGTAGLSAMPESSMLGANLLLRPLLGVRRVSIRAYADAQQLSWVEDPSNADPRYDRNYLRLKVVPELRKRWPAAAETMSRSARHIAEAGRLVDELAALDLATIRRGMVVVLAHLIELSAARQRAAIRRWLDERGCSTPDEVHLARILRELPAARVDANPLVRWHGGEVRRFKGVLLVVPALPSIVRPLVWNWRRQRALPLGEGMGYLRISVGPKGAWRHSELPARLQVRFRHGGERVAQDAQHLRLKEILRAAGVFPWMRERLPLVSGAGEMWCVPGVWRRPSAPGRHPNHLAQRVSIEWCDAPVWRLAELVVP